MGARKIAILLHERDRYPKADGHFIWALCETWRSWGIEIELLRGPGGFVPGALLIPHVDATILPQPYVDFIEKYPCAINRRVIDISKRAISKNLVSSGDSYEGPVIVKTNLNCGGITDLTFRGRKIVYSGTKKRTGAWRDMFRKTRASSNWAKVNCIGTNEYPVFRSARDVPEAVFANRALVVERFLPECEEGFFHTRYCLFFGERATCWRIRSASPVVKRLDCILDEKVGVPEELDAIRRGMGLDYGKIDFVIREGKVVLLDVNRTPGLLGDAQTRAGYTAEVAPGIHAFLDRAADGHERESSDGPSSNC